MKEEERKEIINKIQTEIKEKESLEKMYKRLKYQTQIGKNLKIHILY